MGCLSGCPAHTGYAELQVSEIWTSLYPLPETHPHNTDTAAVGADRVSMSSIKLIQSDPICRIVLCKNIVLDIFPNPGRGTAPRSSAVPG